MKFNFSGINIFINLLVIISVSSNPIFANDKIGRDSMLLKMQMLKYGLFVHYVPGLTTYKNGIICKNIDSLTENFNENKFAQDLSEMKVQYIVFTAWHSKMIPLYPSKIMNYWRQGYSGSRRDLIGDMIKAVSKKGIKVFLYTTPRDGHEFTNLDKELTGWGIGKNAINGWDPFWDNFSYLKWNDFINDAYAELVEKYGSKIEGLFLDEGSPDGDSYRVIDYPRLVKTIKKNHPHLILIQNNYGNNYGLDILDKEYNLWGEFKNTDGNYWPAYTIPVLTVISSSWWATTAEGKKVVKFSASDLARYIILESAVNTEGGGVQLAAGPYADGGWETGVKDTLIKVGKLLESIKHSIFNTIPSKIFPTTSGLAIKDLNWGSATTSLDNRFEYLHLLKPVTGNKIFLKTAIKNIRIKNVEFLLNRLPIPFNQMDDSVVLILPKTNLSLFDQVIRLKVENNKKEKATSKFVNDTDTGIIYRRGWGYSRWERNHGDYDADIHFTEANGDYFQYSFTGSGIEYISNKSMDQGTFQVYIDNVLQGSYNAFSKGYEAQQVLFSKTKLSFKKHTLKVVKGSGKFISLDALKIYF